MEIRLEPLRPVLFYKEVCDSNVDVASWLFELRLVVDRAYYHRSQPEDPLLYRQVTPATTRLVVGDEAAARPRVFMLSDGHVTFILFDRYYMTVPGSPVNYWWLTGSKIDLVTNLLSEDYNFEGSGWVIREWLDLTRAAAVVGKLGACWFRDEAPLVG